MSSVELTRKIPGEFEGLRQGESPRWDLMEAIGPPWKFVAVRRSILFSDELLTGPACLMRGSHLPGAFHRVFVFFRFFAGGLSYLSSSNRFFLQALATKCTTPAQCLLCQKVGNLTFCRVQQMDKKSSHIKAMQRRF